MKTSSLFQLIILKVLCFQQIATLIIDQKNVLNILLMEYSLNPYKWENKLPDFTNIILNEQLVQALNSQQQVTNVQSLYNEAIKKMYDKIPLQDLVEQLWQIYKKYDVQSFITTTRAQLALYGRYRSDEIEDPYYVLLAAHCFYKIKNDVFFGRLNKYTQHLINASIQNLPLSLQYLFGKQEFCLHNDRYAEMICHVIDHKINMKTSQVLSLPRNKNDNLDILQAIFEETEDDNLSDINLALVSKHFQGYYHRLPDYGNQIGTNDTKRQVDNFLWSVELVDDNQLVFAQEEYLMCRNGSIVYGSKEKTIYGKECQWSAGECNSINFNLNKKKIY